jgi:transcriptional regulator with XRE-family HTH domain
VSPSAPPSRLRRQLAAELGQLRALSGLTVRELARRLELSNHARLSRIQSGTSLPDKALTEAWLTHTRADDATSDRVRALLQAAHAETVKWSDALSEAGVPHLQDVAAAREQAATLVCSYEQAYVPGLAQTTEYARALLARFDLDQDLAAAVAARMRRQELLYGAGREFRFVVTRRALSWPPGPEVSMSAQAAKLVELDRLPSVQVRVLEDDSAVMGSYSSFNVYVGDEQLVTIELENDEVRLTDEESVAIYRKRFDELFDAARPIAEVA